MKHRSRWLTTGIAAIIILGIGYGWRTSHYKTHFLSDTEIGGIQVGGQTAFQAAKTLQTHLTNQRYTVNEDHQQLASFTSKQAGLKAYSSSQLQVLLKKQNAFSWPAHVTNASANEQKLSRQAINDTDLTALANQIVTKANQTPRTKTQNARLVYADHVFKIKAPVYGTQVTTASVKSALAEAIENNRATINLKTAYVKPTVRSNSPALKTAQTKAKKLADNKVTYQLANHKVTIPRETIASWLTTKNGTISTNQAKMLKWLTKLSYRYGSVHQTRHFKTHSGSTVSVPAGLYGWSIKVASETPALSKVILDGKSTTRTPIIQGTGYHKNGTDIGNTYVEVSKSAQHMWIYKHGKVVISTPVVTGKPVKGTTPSGVYVVWNKQHNATLRGKNDDGSNYASKVSYWMPVDDTGVGIHDSPWQPRYGGNWYLTHGSHGCVNTPPSVMKQVFATVSINTPVVIY